MSRPDGPLRILAFEPFDAGSHRAVREAIARHSRHTWTWMTRPGRYWKWRMRVAAIEMIEAAQQQGMLDDRIDVVFATSLMSAADLRAMLPSALRLKPLILYMHENQAAYPEGHQDELAAERDLQFPVTNLTSVLAADRVIWNSAWNRDSFLDGMQPILKFGPDLQMPDGLRDRVLAKSCVIWPPVELPEAAREADEAARVLHNAEAGGCHGAAAAESRTGNEGRSSNARDVVTPGRPVRIVWPHRWEHDKGPDELLAMARQHTASLNLRWTILGERYRRVPQAMRDFEREFADRIDHIGYEPERDRYWQHLARSDWVLSTARHEFFGIAVVEAMLAGCLPWLPERLSYPELVPPDARGLTPGDPPSNQEMIRKMIADHLKDALAPAAVSRLDRAIELAAAAGGTDDPIQTAGRAAEPAPPD